MVNFVDIIKSDLHQNYIFFISSKEVPYSKGLNFLFYDNKDTIFTEDLNISDFLKDSKGSGCFVGGYLGYPLKNSLEKLTQDSNSFINLPSLSLSSYESKLDISGADMESYDVKFSARSFSPEIKTLESNMTKAEYLDKVRDIKRRIISGDLYQANLTRKFYGEFEGDIKPVELFFRLNQISPAPYSSLIRDGDLYILSSSPELFFEVNKEREVITCPIKGSSKAGQEGADYLSNSFKDKAENLMITDLMRNDISRSCVSGSVKVEDLFATEQFKTVNHMYSKVSGGLKPDEDSLSLLKNIFPPGSMTGAPKIMAMEVCSELEKQSRGVYSGAIGYFAPDGSAQFSVVIRTLIIQGNKFEFQVGGGIVYDSEPEAEWEETMIKAKGISELLSITNDIRGL